MKRLTKLLLILSLVCGAALESSAQWTTDLRMAVAKARAEDKLVYVFFTGSDWCPPCMRLKQEILSSREFLQFAHQNLVLVEVDFPRRKPQSEALKKINEARKEKYNITAFPTVIVFNSAGEELLRHTSKGGTAKAYVEQLRKLRPDKTAAAN